jgi:response regulator of citrate/malate metabolism
MYRHEQFFYKRSTNHYSLHNKILHDTTVMATAIMGMDLCTLWWLIQWIEERKAGIAAADIAGNVGRARRLRSYKEWVYENRMKAEAGMTHARNTPPLLPLTPE